MGGIWGSKKTVLTLRFDMDTAFAPHGMVTKSLGLRNPNPYLRAAIIYRAQIHPLWRIDLRIGKTLVRSSMIDRAADSIGRKVVEVPVVFKWFVERLTNFTIFFGGEDSAGAIFLRKDGPVWSTDKDGMIVTLLSDVILAVPGKDAV